MAEIIRMPRLSDTMEEGVIAGWEKKVGDDVEPGDLLAEIETDKATMEFDSPYEGTLLHIAVESGSVPVNGVIAIIGEEGEDWQTLLEQENASSNGSVAKAEEPAKEAVAEEKAPEEEKPSAEPTAEKPEVSTNAQDDNRVKASPLARSMAKEAGLELSGIEGSGDNGRIIKRDIEAKISTTAAPSEKPATALSFVPAGTDAYTEEPVSQMRKTIARRLGESKFSAPHFYLTMEIQMDEAAKWRKQINEVAEAKISYNDLIIKAVAVALRKHPAVNSSWMEDHIRRNQQVHIGVAVAVDEGLLVPVVRHADMKSLSQINAEVKDMAGRARERKLGLDEMQGNTFTISNLGMFGIDEFTAIINPPDACILAVGGIQKRPIYDAEGNIKPAMLMKITLSCDHRVVDGALGSQFLQTLKGILEEPVRLLV